MALGPQAQRKTRESILKKAEKIIDSFILHDTTGEITINVDLLPARLDSRHWATELRPKYIAAGWKRADWITDSREGDYLRFVS